MRLNLNREPEWVELLPGVSVLAAPATSAVFGMARRDPLIADAPEQEIGAVALAKAVAKLTIRDWKGVSLDDDAPAPVTPENVEALLDHYGAFQAWQLRYMARWLGLESEKNGSAPSPSGTTAGAPTTAPRARRAAKRAPKPSTRRKP